MGESLWFIVGMDENLGYLLFLGCGEGDWFLDGFLFLSLNFDVVLVLRCSVLEVESDRQIKIELNSSALVTSIEGIVQLDINLWSIEGTILGLDCPWLSESLQSTLESVLSLIPHLLLTNIVLRSRGEGEAVLKAEQFVHIINEIEGILDLVLLKRIHE